MGLELTVRDHQIFRVDVSIWLVIGTALAFTMWLIRRRPWRNISIRKYEIDEAAIGIGQQRITLRPNLDDLQVAYRFWTELKTRKLGLRVEDDDIISEVYDSWYSFYQVARELIKEIPVSKVRSSEATRTVIQLTLGVLNEEIRPHLTRWQARFRHWWVPALQRAAMEEASTPQSVQRTYPSYDELMGELRGVNGKLIAYADELGKMVGIDPSP